MSQRYAVTYRRAARRLGFQTPSRDRRAGVRIASRQIRRLATTQVVASYVSHLGKLPMIARPPILPGVSALYGLGLLFRFGPLSGPGWWQAQARYFDGWRKTADHVAPDGVSLHLSASEGYEHVIQEGADGVRVDKSGAPHIGDQSSTAGAWPAETSAVTVFTAAAVCTEGTHWRTHSSWARDVAAVPSPAVRIYPQLIPPATSPAWSPARWLDPMVMPVNAPLVALPRPLPVRMRRPMRDALGHRIRAHDGAVPTPPRPRKPRSGTKEEKIVVTVAGRTSLARWISAVTESLDLLDAIWRAVPPPNWTGSDRHVRGYITPQEKFRDIYERFDEIDWIEAMGNIAYETIEDRAYGWVGRRMADAAGTNPYYARPVGFQTGPLH